MTAAPRLLPRVRAWLAAQEVMRLAALVAIAAFLADWALKSWAMESLTNTHATTVSWLLRPTHNDAFAFSAGADFVAAQFVVLARLVALYGLGVVFGRLVICDQRSAVGFGLVLGGGIGNTADLAFHDAVMDFINVGPFTLHLGGGLFDIHFVFNGADVAILIGIALLAPRLQACALVAQRRIADWESRLRLDRRLFL